MNNKKIAPIGLVCVSLPHFTEFGKIRTVSGFDIDYPGIDDLKNGIDSTIEGSTNKEIK